MRLALWGRIEEEEIADLTGETMNASLPFLQLPPVSGEILDVISYKKWEHGLLMDLFKGRREKSRGFPQSGR